jgi:dienelactone hydrolase
MRYLLLALLVSCTAPNKGTDPATRGPYAVGSRTLMLVDQARNRTLPVEVWYPADASAKAAADTGESIAAMVPDAANRALFEGWLKAAPASCGTRTVHSARNAAPASGQWPLVIVSHCHDCTRFAYASIAEHLASHGIAVAAPDHVGNTVFDEMAGHGLGLTQETLQLRVGDVQFVLTTLLNANATEVDSSLRGHFDANHIGAMGHSFGSVTTGFFTKSEARIKAIVGLAAPMENPLFEGLVMADIPKPLLYVLATEDNSIGTLGNGFIETNYSDAASPAWKIEITDAGHYSVTDLDGILPEYSAGCGQGLRQVDMAPFTYASFADTIDITRTWVTAHFAAQLQDDPAAKAFLESPPARAGVATTKK